MVRRVFLGISASVVLITLLVLTSFALWERQNIHPAQKGEIQGATTHFTNQQLLGFAPLLTQPATPGATATPSTVPQPTLSPLPSLTASQPISQALSPSSPPLQLTPQPPPWLLLILLGGGATILTIVGIILLF